jgi:Domain of unknown function (DUF305)
VNLFIDPFSALIRSYEILANRQPCRSRAASLGILAYRDSGMCSARFRFVLLCFIGLLLSSCEKSDSPVDAALGQSMSVMHSAMHEVALVGKADADFARMMIPHHQGAIEMAKVELEFGADPNLRRLAQEIIVTQQSEIDVMNLALKKYPQAAKKKNNWCSQW